MQSNDEVNVIDSSIAAAKTYHEKTICDWNAIYIDG